MYNKQCLASTMCGNTLKNGVCYFTLFFIGATDDPSILGKNILGLLYLVDNKILKKYIFHIFTSEGLFQISNFLCFESSANEQKRLVLAHLHWVWHMKS